jgi:PhoPQ-activated pathogenicity-related protein
MKKGIIAVLVLVLFFISNPVSARGINPYEQFSTSLMEKIVDYGARTDGQPVYIGYRIIGKTDDVEGCIIFKCLYDENDNFLRMIAADGDNSPNKIWDNRASYTYTED